MKTPLALVALALTVTTTSLFCVDRSCPLYAERPVENFNFMATVDALEFQIDRAADKPSFKEQLAKTLQDLRRFHELTTKPMPTNLDEEVKRMIGLLVDDFAALVFKMEKEKKSPSGNSEELVQLMRILYSSSEKLQKVGAAVNIALDLADRLKEMTAALDKSLKEHFALRDRNFAAKVCEWLKAEAQRRNCPGDHGALPLAKGQAPYKMLKKDQLKEINAMLREIHKRQGDARDLFETKGRAKTDFVQFLMNKHKPDLEFPNVVADLYYDHVVPLIKLCGVGQAMVRYGSADTKQQMRDACSPLLCAEKGLYCDGDAQGDVLDEMAVCRYLNDFDSLQARYLTGYRQFIAGVLKERKEQKKAQNLVAKVEGIVAATTTPASLCPQGGEEGYLRNVELRRHADAREQAAEEYRRAHPPLLRPPEPGEFRRFDTIPVVPSHGAGGSAWPDDDIPRRLPPVSP